MSGISHGYISTGEALILLKIEESAPHELHVHLVPVATELDDFNPRNPAVAQLATLTIMGLRLTEMSRDCISKAENCGICHWPLLP